MEEPQAARTPEQPTAISKEERTWGMAAHLSALAGFVGVPFGNILGPLVVWLIKRDEMPFVADQGKEALNFQISVTIYVAICVPLMLVIIGIVLAVVVGVVALVLTIVAALRANEGVAYRYPYTIRLVK